MREGSALAVWPGASRLPLRAAVISMPSQEVEEGTFVSVAGSPE